MRFTDFINKNNVPNVVLEFTKNRKVRAITKYHHSGDLVYDIDNMFILKISTYSRRLLEEKIINDQLESTNFFSKSVIYVESDKYCYYIKTKLKGTSLISKINNPKLLIKLLKEALELCHGINPELISVKNPESIGKVFVHGDFCLPNILVYRNKVSGFIDTSQSGLGDPWVDYAWCIWSFEYNLGTNEYTNDLLETLGITFDEEKYNYYTNIDD